MAKQKGIIKLEGTIGDISFYKSKDGFIAREKGGLDASRIANDPAFKRTRENGAEFGHAGTAGKLLRTAFRTLLAKASDGRMVSRLTKAMIKVLQADQTSTRGQRNVIDGEAMLLKGFEFNEEAHFTSSFFAPMTTNANRVNGNYGVSVPDFISGSMLSAPGGATHFKLSCGAAEIDFENNTYVMASSSTADLPIENAVTSTLQLQNALTANSTLPVFIVLGIEFSQLVNGTMYPLQSGAHNAMAIVEVSVI